ncbi:UNVERIFIED_CONTAM: hypothetical protein HDU68_005580 [Siphonaria sp. JEL0065]|nr:hypothetical protein HDU68_005580 [Siphonaria sp. JEL0065]
MFICLFVTSVSTNGIWPDDLLQLVLWMTVVSVGFLVTMPTILFCYISTYIFITKALQETLTHSTDRFRIILQKRVLLNCFIMSGTVFVCYIPQIIYFVLLGTKVIVEGTTADSWANAVQQQFIALDPVLAPILVMYFMKPTTRLGRKQSVSSFYDEE